MPCEITQSIRRRERIDKIWRIRNDMIESFSRFQCRIGLIFRIRSSLLFHFRALGSLSPRLLSLRSLSLHLRPLDSLSSHLQPFRSHRVRERKLLHRHRMQHKPVRPLARLKISPCRIASRLIHLDRLHHAVCLFCSLRQLQGYQSGTCAYIKYCFISRGIHSAPRPEQHPIGTDLHRTPILANSETLEAKHITPGHINCHFRSPAIPAPNSAKSNRTGSAGSNSRSRAVTSSTARQSFCRRDKSPSERATAALCTSSGR